MFVRGVCGRKVRRNNKGKDGEGSKEERERGG